MPKVTWTGKNLAAMKKLHPRVRHYPENPNKPHYRDWTQHPDNLHVELGGATNIVEIGDSLVRDAKGNVTIEKARTPRAPRALRPPPPSTGTTHHAHGEN